MPTGRAIVPEQPTKDAAVWYIEMPTALRARLDAFVRRTRRKLKGEVCNAIEQYLDREEGARSPACADGTASDQDHGVLAARGDAATDQDHGFRPPFGQGRFGEGTPNGQGDARRGPGNHRGQDGAGIP